MIKGIGIDICDIKRLKTAMEKNKGFIKRVFSEREISYCGGKKQPYLHFAGRFAVKESFIKAVSIDRAIKLREIETKNTPEGRPEIIKKGKVNKLLKKVRAKKIHVSISHTGGAAAAVCVLE